jgi:uncharacterized protein YfeS
LLECGFANDEELMQIRAEAEAKRAAERATKSAWDLLDIDWDEFHPQAREVLDDPFFWDCVDDLAPHGNDTGADLLEDYRRWQKRNPSGSLLKFLAVLMKRWDIEPIDWNIVDEEQTNALAAGKPINLQVCNEAIIGLAFAAIKVKGQCPKAVVDLALKALERESFEFVDSHLEEKLRKERHAEIAKMRAKLLRAV